MKIWSNGSYQDIEIGQKVFVGHCGSEHTCFGEYGVLERATTRHLVFKTDSGTVIKTAIDNINNVIGKAGKQGNFVSLRLERDFIKSPTLIY